MSKEDDLVAIRRAKLREFIDTRCGGSQAVAVRRYELKNAGEISALLRNRSFGEKRARRLERELGLPPFWLDDKVEPDADTALGRACRRFRAAYAAAPPEIRKLLDSALLGAEAYIGSEALRRKGPQPPHPAGSLLRLPPPG